MIRTGRTSTSITPRRTTQHPAERELYDLKADPGEFHNLAGDARPEGPHPKKMHAALVKEIGEDPEKTEQRCRAEWRGATLTLASRRQEPARRKAAKAAAR